jgi:hypothetical protein
MLVSYSKKLFILCATLLLVGCKPEMMNIEVYTSDVELAAEGELFEVPVQVEFSLLGDDEDGTLDRVIVASKKYLSQDSSFSRSKGMMGDRLVIDTKLPLGNAAALSDFLSRNNRLAYIEVSRDDDAKFVFLEKTNNLISFHRELQSMNMLLGLDLPSTKTVVRVSSDSRKPVGVYATAVFVSKKPYLHYETSLNRREAIELEFNGSEGSVYSEIYPTFAIQ